jgi:hypothetical protein
MENLVDSFNQALDNEDDVNMKWVVWRAKIFHPNDPLAGQLSVFVKIRDKMRSDPSWKTQWVEVQ